MGALKHTRLSGAAVALGSRRGRAAAATFIALLACVAFAAQAQAATYTVGTTSDTTGTCANPAAGTCSLRQLINYENAHAPSPPDTIVVPAGFYGLNSSRRGSDRLREHDDRGSGRRIDDDRPGVPDPGSACSTYRSRRVAPPPR